MNTESQPFVSVLTPVYNGELFLVECIESVLKQTHKNFEYIIVNNYSTDRTLEIALAYAKKDSRVQVHSNDKFVGVIENHNISFNLVSPEAKYCKVVSADDFIFENCLMQMVKVAEANPSVGIVGSYQLRESCVRWQGFKYPREVLPGREMCRQTFLGNDPSFGTGSPTSILYRADLVRSSRRFYPNTSPHADTSACFKHLQDCDFGFVYQVLSYERIHSETQSSRSGEINRYSSANLNDIIQYGHLYLSTEEVERIKKKYLNRYYRFLAVSVFEFRGKEFWDYHKSRLEELGYPITFFKLLKAFIVMVSQELTNPEQAFRKFVRRFFSKKKR